MILIRPSKIRSSPSRSPLLLSDPHSCVHICWPKTRNAEDVVYVLQNRQPENAGQHLSSTTMLCEERDAWMLRPGRSLFLCTQGTWCQAFLVASSHCRSTKSTTSLSNKDQQPLPLCVVPWCLEAIVLRMGQPHLQTFSWRHVLQKCPRRRHGEDQHREQEWTIWCGTDRNQLLVVVVSCCSSCKKGW